MSESSKHCVIESIIVGDEVHCQVVDITTNHSCILMFRKTAETRTLEFGDMILIDANVKPGNLTAYHLPKENSNVKIQLLICGVGEVKHETQ